jgi:hypothetical protein
MIYAITITVLLVLLAITLLIYGTKGEYENRYMLAGIFGLIIAVIAAIALILIGIFGYEYIAAKYKADVINKEFNTKYTQIEIFYADDVIEEIRQMKRQRFEINGNLFKEQKHE